MSTQLPKFGSRDSHPTVPKHVTLMYSTRYVHPQTQSAGNVGVCTENHVDGIGAASHPPLIRLSRQLISRIATLSQRKELVLLFYMVIYCTQDVAAQGSHSEQLLNL